MNEPPKPAASLLERLTGLVLILVMLAIGWMVLATLIPEMPRVVSLKAEVITMIGLLAAALALVSVVALLHTRK